MSQTINYLLPVFYLLVSIYYGYIFFNRNKKVENKSVITLLLLIVFHILHLIVRGTLIESIPLTTKLDALSVLALAIVFLNLINEMSLKTKSIGFFALIFSFFIQTISSTFYSWDIQQHTWQLNSVFIFHVLFTILGYAAICMSTLYALFYIMLNHKIKNRQLGLIYDRLPSLNVLETMSIRSVLIGIVALGLGILLGHLHAGKYLGTYWPVDAKVIYSNIIWFGYFAGYIFAHLKNWRGRWMAYLSILGFAILILANMSIFFIQNTFHNFK